VVLTSFFQCGFKLPTCEFLHKLLHHYEIELVHLNPNSILQIVVFVHLCEAFFGVPLNFSLFKSYLLPKYQPSVDNRKVIGSVGLQTRPHSGFLHLPMKTSLKGWHKSWFYCENHEPDLSPPHPSLVAPSIQWYLVRRTHTYRAPNRSRPSQSSQRP
jgi:hypothetical protein